MIAMTGPNLAAIVIPVVVMFGLAVWIVMVFHADRHPLWQNRTAAAPKQAPARHGRKVSARSPRRPYPAATTHPFSAGVAHR
jgi:hypothetical protein